MNKINRILMVAIGDVAAQTVLEAKPMGEHFHVDGQPYPIGSRMDYMNYKDPEEYFKDIDKTLLDDTLLFFVINLSSPGSLIDYARLDAEVAKHYSVRNNTIIKKASSVGNIVDEIIEQISITIKNANAPSETVSKFIDTPSDEEIAALMPADVPPWVPKKVLIAIGNSSCLFLNLQRLEYAGKNESDLAFVPNRDDYYLLPKFSEAGESSDLNDLSQIVLGRHNDKNQYIFIMDQSWGQENSPTVTFFYSLKDIAGEESVHLIVVPSDYQDENHSTHTQLRGILCTQLQVSENIIQGFSAAHETNQDQMQAKPEDRKARKIILVYGHDSTTMVNSLGGLLDPKEDACHICPDLTLVSTPEIDKALEEVRSIYSDKDEVYLLADENFLKGPAGAYIRNNLSSITNENYLYTAVSNYHNLSSQNLREKQLIANELRAMNHRIAERNSNTQEKETKMNEQNNQPQDIHAVVMQILTPILSGIERQMFSMNMQIQNLARRVSQGSMFGPGVTHPFSPSMSAVFAEQARSQASGWSNKGFEVPHYDYGMPPGFPPVSGTDNAGMFKPVYNSDSEAKAQNTHRYLSNGGRDFNIGSFQGTRSIHDKVRSPIDNPQPHPLSALVPKRKISLVYPNHYIATQMAQFLNSEVVSNPQVREVMSLIDIREFELYEMVRGAGHEADDVIVIVTQGPSKVDEEALHAITFTNSHVPEYKDKAIRRLNVLQFGSYLTGILVGFKMVDNKISKQ